MKKKLTREEIMVLTSAALFLIGGVFMLINVFGGEAWSFWAGFSIVMVATVLVILGGFLGRKTVTSNLKETAKPAEEPENKEV